MLRPFWIRRSLGLFLVLTFQVTSAWAQGPIRLGVQLQECSNCGMIHVTGVTAGAPATQLKRVSDHLPFTLEADNDSISHINGVRVRSLKEWFREFDRASGWTKLRIFDKSRQETDDYWVYLGAAVEPPHAQESRRFPNTQPLNPRFSYPYGNNDPGSIRNLRNAERRREDMERWVEQNERYPLNVTTP